MKGAQQVLGISEKIWYFHGAEEAGGCFSGEAPQ
jgi:hypothetical protein